MRALELALGGLALLAMPLGVPCAPARAEDTTDVTREGVLVALDVSLPEHCGDGSVLRARVERILGREIFVAPGDMRPHASATLRSEEDDTGHWLTTITLSDATSTLGQRSLHGDHGGCDAITDTASLVLALMLDLDRTDVVLSAPSHVQEDAPAAQGSDASSTSSAPTPRSGDRWTLEVDLALGGALGALPGPTPTGRARIGLSLRDVVSIDLSAAIVPAQSFASDGLGARLGLFTFGLAVCPTLVRDGALGLEGCVGLDAGVLEASGLGLSAPRDATVPFLSPAAELRGALWPTNALAVTLAAGVGVPVIAHRFTASGATGERTLLVMEPLWGRLELGLCVSADLSGSPVASE